MASLKLSAITTGTFASATDALVGVRSGATDLLLTPGYTGTGNTLVLSTSPALTTPNIGTPSAGTLTNCTGLPNASVVGLGTMATQAASAVAITGGTIDAVTIGATTPVAAQVHRPANAQTGTTYTLVIGDQDKCVTMNNASASTLTIPANASVAFPVNTEIDLIQLGAGQVTVAITSDTLNSYTSKVKLAGQYAGATLKKTASTTWILIGNLA